MAERLNNLPWATEVIELVQTSSLTLKSEPVRTKLHYFTDMTLQILYTLFVFLGLLPFSLCQPSISFLKNRVTFSHFHYVKTSRVLVDFTQIALIWHGASPKLPTTSSSPNRFFKYKNDVERNFLLFPISLSQIPQETLSLRQINSVSFSLRESQLQLIQINYSKCPITYQDDLCDNFWVSILGKDHR